MRSTRRIGVIAAVVLLAPLASSAQDLGTFRWQFAPHCNVVTLRVEQKVNSFALTGTDDQCGAGVVAAANGSAHLNPNGTVGLALTVVRPDGLSMTSSATLNLATISGAWSDEFANQGTLVFNPGPASGEPRRITLTGVYSIAFIAVFNGSFARTHISFGRTLASPPQAPAANIIPLGGPATTNCPGTHAAPRALPGQLCVYESFRINVHTRLILGSGTDQEGASANGAVLYLNTVSTGAARWEGKWAVTIP